MKLLVLALACVVACHHDPEPTVPTARILSAVPDAVAVTALLVARGSRFKGYTPDQLGFDRAHASVFDDFVSGPALLECRLESSSREQIEAAWSELARAFRAALPAGWQVRDDGKQLHIGPPGDNAIVVAWESHGLLHKTYAVELDVWSGAVPSTFDPASADPVADVLAASARGFARYSPTPLGFPEIDGVATRIDDTSVGKALHCERHSGSKSDIKHAFRTLVSRFKASVPKDWRVDDQGDVVTFYPPGENASSAVVIAWSDRKPGFIDRLSTRAAQPTKDERYLLALDVFPIK